MEPLKVLVQEKISIDFENCSDTSAAWIVDNFNGFGYDDWFLPSKDELEVIYQNIYSTGILSNVNEVWSSSEDTTTGQWYGIRHKVMLGECHGGHHNVIQQVNQVIV